MVGLRIEVGKGGGGAGPKLAALAFYLTAPLVVPQSFKPLNTAQLANSAKCGKNRDNIDVLSCYESPKRAIMWLLTILYPC